MWGASPTFSFGAREKLPFMLCCVVHNIMVILAERRRGCYQLAIHPMPKHLKQLDGIRGIAILWVIAYDYRNFLPKEEFTACRG